MVIREKKIIIKKIKKQCIVDRYDNFWNLKHLCAEQYAIVKNEELRLISLVEKKSNCNALKRKYVNRVDLQGHYLAENIAKLHLESYNIDNDNDPTLENIPSI